MTDLSEMPDEELYDHIVDEIETALEIDTSSLEIDVADGFVSIWGSVSSIEISEELERLLFDGLGLEDVDFDVVIDEGIQRPPEEIDEDARSREDLDLSGGSEFDDFSNPRHQI